MNGPGDDRADRDELELRRIRFRKDHGVATAFDFHQEHLIRRRLVDAAFEKQEQERADPRHR